MICIDLFIQTELIVFGQGYGDNRGFDWDSPPDRSRAYLYLYLDSEGRLLQTETHINESCLRFAGCFGPYFEYNRFTVRQASPADDLTIDWQLTNGFSGFLFRGSEYLIAAHCMVPANLMVGAAGITLPPIDGTLTLSRNSGGQWYLGRLNRDPYPSLEIYYYEDGRLVDVIDQRPEKPSGHPEIGLQPPSLRPWLPNDTVP